MKPFVIERVFDVSRERMWEVWTDPKHLVKWWGPKGFTVASLRMDVRVGGTTLYCLKAPDGAELWGRFVYREIRKPERLVWINSFSDPKGGLTRHPWSENWPLEMHTVAEFRAEGKKTRVVITWSPMEGSTDVERRTFDDGRASMNMGWSGTLEQLEAFLG